VLFRSPLFGLLAMIPLTVTITFIYGIIGLVGKDYDMPVAVLSSLTLGLSVDFAIHFLERARELTRQHGTWKAAIWFMFQEPAMAISRNAIIISIGFTPLLFAPLVPYKTVGFFLATIMAASWIGTLFILAALITGLQKFLFKHEDTKDSKEE
jgi:predicted RND superfamily exporter protein